ncbi:MAG TPA: efflux transporter outer membrane subunit [Dongiaceae bacterium]|nr:efflux transporter outer membrane subunit [Dongiaceae bacterium]
MTSKRLARSLLFVAAASLAGCTVGPNYQRASAPAATHWDVAEPWRESAPKDALGKGDWWSVFHDDTLASLESDALQSNQTIKIGAARLQQARALAAVQISTQFPQVGASFSPERQRISGNRPPNSNVTPAGPVTQNSFTLPFTVSYELDLFGRRRRSIEAAQANYQASAADLENVRLVITSELAADYFSLRQLDTQIGLLSRTVEALSKGLDLVQSRYKGGVASGLDVAQEETLLATTRTQLTLLRQQRKQFEDAIAVLVGKPAPDFRLDARELNAEPPALNAGLPSDLLERRPDIAEAERQMAVANAQIGIARAAYYPSFNLFANGGWQAADIAKLVNVQSTFWAVGANVAESIFTGGARRAQVQYAQANYDATVAGYRQTVLDAFREVQDDLTGLSVIDQAYQSQQQAVNASRRTLDIATSRYTGGLVSYLDVVSAQQNLLNNEQELAVLQGQKLITSVLLVKALGGGWDASSLAALQVKSKVKDVVAP